MTLFLGGIGFGVPKAVMIQRRISCLPTYLHVCLSFCIYSHGRPLSRRMNTRKRGQEHTKGGPGSDHRK